MSILYVLVPLGLILLAIAVWAFFWAVDHDQFDDLDRAAESILFDDDVAPPAPRPMAEAAPPGAKDREVE